MSPTAKAWIESQNTWISEVPMRTIHDPWTEANAAGIQITEEEAETIDWLQYCFECMDVGADWLLQPDPYYQRPDGKAPLTIEEIEKVIAGIDEVFEYEKRQFSGTHLRKTGNSETPDFKRLTQTAQRCVVEGCETIMKKWNIFYRRRIREMVQDGSYSEHNHGRTPPGDES